MAQRYSVGPATRVVNAVFRAMTRLGIGARYRHVLMVRGRRTGAEHSVPVDVMSDGERRWLVAPYGETNWVRNARAAGRVKLSRRGRSEEVRVEEVAPGERAPVLRRYLREVPVARPYFDVTLGSSDEELAAEGPRHPVFLVVGG